MIDVVRLATRRPDAELGRWSRRPVGHRVDNMTTHSLDRYTGTLTDGTTWSLIAKTLHPASESPYFEMIPEEHREPTLVALNWRDEPRMYRCGIGDHCQVTCRCHASTPSTSRPIGSESGWTRSSTPTRGIRPATTAPRWRSVASVAHGRRRTPSSGSASATASIGDLFFGKIVNFDLPMQADDQFWRDPAVADAVDDRFRRDLFDLAERMPAMIARLDDVPRGVCHGDATPHNFLEPGDGTVVAVDWAYCNVDSVASDLGQLLAGRFESGSDDAGELDTIATRGLRRVSGGSCRRGRRDRGGRPGARLGHTSRDSFGVLGAHRRPSRRSRRRGPRRARRSPCRARQVRARPRAQARRERRTSRPMTARGPDHPLIDVRAGRSEPRRRRPGARTAPPGGATTARPDR